MAVGHWPGQWPVLPGGVATAASEFRLNKSASEGGWQSLIHWRQSFVGFRKGMPRNIICWPDAGEHTKVVAPAMSDVIGNGKKRRT